MNGAKMTQFFAENGRPARLRAHPPRKIGIQVDFWSRLHPGGWGSLPPVDVWINFGWMIFGMALLYFGAEWLVTGSSELALRFGISPLVVGLTIVAFGTSAPELLVGIQANLKDPPQGDLALGNVVGSNIYNIALILGVGALIRPIVIHAQIIKRELPILLVASVVFVAMLWDGEVTRWEGVVLTLGIVGYVVMSLRLAKVEPDQVQFEEFEEEDLARAKKPGRLKVDLFLILFGLAALIYGADRLVGSGMALAQIYGVPEAIIALSLFALGTSLPELATSIVASLKNQGDIITGNAVGSCIFNILAVVGITALVAPINSNEVRKEDLWVMIGVAAVIMPFMWTRKSLSRFEGGLLVAGSIAYTLYLGVRAGII